MIPAPPDTGQVHARAESLLTHGELAAARELLESHLRVHAHDVRALVLLGRVHLDWPVIGRFKALALFDRAARLAPEDPEPRYWRVVVGRTLGGADGESIIRTGLFALWEVAPGYRDTWEVWRTIYRGDGDRRRAVDILAAHAGDPGADLRRAELLIELQRYDDADAILADLASRNRDASAWALWAQSALEAGDTERGMERYWEAVRRAGSDTTEALWRQVDAIASPEEERAYATSAHVERPAFFRAFWASREPDLTTAENERVAEHFRRVRHAREQYRLLHPMNAFHRSPLRRVLAGNVAPEIGRIAAEFGARGVYLEHRSAFEEAIQSAGLGVDVRDLPEPDSLTRYRRFGLDGRGLIYLRFGKPQQTYVSSGLQAGEVEVWRHLVDGEPVVVTFARASGVSGFADVLSGDMLVYPTSQRELHNSAVMLERDETSFAAKLPVRVWVATFRSETRQRQDVLIGSEPRAAAAARWPRGGELAGRPVGEAPFIFTVPVGDHHLGVDARRADRLGRLRETVTVPWYWGERLALSSILVGVAADTAFGRDDVARAMPADLRFPANAALALYAEIYNLPADGTGLATYEVAYTFEPDGGGPGVTFSFVRHRPAAPVLVERLIVEPGEVPRGRYRIRVTVRDRAFGHEVEQARVDVELR
jgi:tetratricopeptide (TPR) repeat protein